MIRPYYSTRYRQSEWTDEERADWEKKEREQNYGMTWLEWCDFVETHDGSEILEFRYQYCLSHGKKWPEGPKYDDSEGRTYDALTHFNTLGIKRGEIKRR